MRAARETDGGGLPARWPGTCHLCHEPFPKGEPIVKMRDKACHVACYKAAHE